MFKPLQLNRSNLSQDFSPDPSHQRSELPVRKLFHWNTDGSLSLHFDWSSLECFLSCNHSALYKLVYSRTSQPRAALAFGAAFHAALEVHYKLCSTTEPTVLLPLCKQAIDHAFSEYTYINWVNEYRTPEYCFECFLKYVTHYKGESLTPVVIDGKPQVEFSFSLDLGMSNLNPAVFAEYGYGTLTDDEEKERACAPVTIPVSIHWTGICDMLAHMGNEVWIVDHKTTSILSEDFYSAFNIAMQPVGYVNAARKLFPDLKIAGFLLNVAACRKPTKTGTSFEPHRSTYRYEDWHFTEWNRDVLALIEEFLNNLQDNCWPRKTTWCVGKYGKCPYFDCCSLPPSIRLDYLNSSYVPNTWKPVSA